jgi:outer membrane cobalamin receptor
VLAGLGLVWLLALPGLAGPPAGQIQGQVVEAKSRTPLAGASVWVAGTGIGALSDAQGRFALRGLGPGPHTLQATYIGYQPARVEGIALDARGLAEVVVELVEKPISLSEITVTPGRFAIMGTEPAASQALTREEIQTMPQLGEDIYRAVTRLPGITGNDFSAKFTVRGGEHDQVLVLLDGLELSDPFHLKDISGGALSIVDASLIEGIDLMTGGFPAEYGDRRSGVFNIKSARAGRQQAALGLSLMNTRALLSGASGQGDWLVSARRGYLDLVLKLMGEEENFRPTYYDLFARVERRLGQRHTLAARFLGARDDLDFVENDQDRSNTRYENAYAWLTLSSAFGPRLLAQTLVAAGRGTHQRRGFALEGESGRMDFEVADERDADFWELKQDWNWEQSDRLYLKGGADFRRLAGHYEYLSAKQRDRWVAADSRVYWIDTTLAARSPAGERLGLYLSGRASLLSPLTAEVGVRFDRISHTGDELLSPRLNLLCSLGKQTALRAGWGYFYQSQGIHELRVEDGEGEFLPAERAEQRVAGFEHRFAAGVHLRLEGYYKKSSRLRPVYRNWLDPMESYPEVQDDRVTLRLGGATARGLEIYLKQDTGGRFTWWASYALARSREQVEQVRWAGGQLALDQELPGRYDQRHTLYLDANFRPNPRWHLNLAWQYRSGWPYTEKFLRQGTWPDGTAYLYEEAGAPYGRRYPAFHRLDLRLNRHFDTSRGRVAVFLEGVNLYNRGNVRAYEYWLQHLPAGEYRYRKTPEYWFRLLPSLGVNWTWDY